MQDTQIIGAVQRVNDLLEQAGVTAQSRYAGGVMYYRYLVPLRDGRLLAFESSVEPQFEIGAGRVAKKIKKGLKTVAKSKAFGKLLKAGAAISSMVPGGQALGAGLALASTVQSKARSKGGLKKAAGSAAKQVVRTPSGRTAHVYWG